MCFTEAQRSTLLAKLGKAADTTDADLTAALLGDYEAQGADITLIHGQKAAAEQEVAALSAAVADRDATILSLSAAVAEKDARVLELSAAGRTVDPEALRDRAANYRDRLALMVDRGQLSNAAQKKIVDNCLNDASPSVMNLSGAADLGGKRPIDFWLDVMESQTPVATNNAVARAVGTAEPPRFGTLDLSGAAGGKADMSPEELQARVDANLAQTELGRRALAARKARETVGAGGSFYTASA